MISIGKSERIVYHASNRRINPCGKREQVFLARGSLLVPCNTTWQQEKQSLSAVFEGRAGRRSLRRRPGQVFHRSMGIVA